MAAQLKEIVDRLNAEPFNLDLSLLVFDEKDLLIDQIFHRYHPWMNGYLCDCFFFSVMDGKEKTTMGYVDGCIDGGYIDG